MFNAISLWLTMPCISAYMYKFGFMGMNANSKNQFSCSGARVKLKKNLSSKMFCRKISCVALNECGGPTKSFTAISKRFLAGKQVDTINKYITYTYVSIKHCAYVYINTSLSEALKKIH